MYTDVISHCHYNNYIQITSSSFNSLQCTEFRSFGELGLQRSLKLPPLRSRTFSKIYSEDFLPKLTVISKTLKQTNNPTKLTCRSSNKEGNKGIETPLGLVEAVTWLSTVRSQALWNYSVLPLLSHRSGSGHDVRVATGDSAEFA